MNRRPNPKHERGENAHLFWPLIIVAFVFYFLAHHLWLLFLVLLIPAAYLGRHFYLGYRESASHVRDRPSPEETDFESTWE